MKASILCALMAVLAILALPPSAAGAPPDATPVMIAVSVDIDEPTQEAQPTDQAPGIVTFTGQVSVDKLPVQRAVVTLESSVDAGWACQISPSTAVFTSTTPQSFDVTAVVPEGTLSTVAGKLLVRAAMTSGGQTAEDTANATITVDQYYRLNVTCDAPYFEADRPGVSTTYKVMVLNKGNGPDSFGVVIENLAQLRSDGWTAILDKEVTPVVRPGLYGEATVTVKSPDRGPIFEGRPKGIILRISSEGARTHNQNITMLFPLVYYQNAIDPVFDVTVPIIVVAVVVSIVAMAAWRWRKRRKRPLQEPAAPPDSDGPIDVEPD
jgi:hypothetical protein